MIKLRKSQRKELGKYWFDLSKIGVGSLIIKLFEPGAPSFKIESLVTLVLGLTFVLLLVILGLVFSKEGR